MSKIENYINEKITKKISEKDFLELLNTLKINKKRLLIYKSFILELNHKIFDTYLGKDYIITEEDKIGHFKWCFNNVCKSFKELNFDFTGNKEIYEHFYEYYTFYLYENPKPLNEKEINNFYDCIFSLHGERLAFHVNEMVELYNSFNKSFKTC